MTSCDGGFSISVDPDKRVARMNVFDKVGSRGQGLLGETAGLCPAFLMKQSL
jgi:hypothetical protein